MYGPVVQGSDGSQLSQTDPALQSHSYTQPQSHISQPSSVEAQTVSPIASTKDESAGPESCADNGPGGSEPSYFPDAPGRLGPLSDRHEADAVSGNTPSSVDHRAPYQPTSVSTFMSPWPAHSQASQPFNSPPISASFLLPWLQRHGRSSITCFLALPVPLQARKAECDGLVRVPCLRDADFVGAGLPAWSTASTLSRL